MKILRISKTLKQSSFLIGQLRHTSSGSDSILLVNEENGVRTLTLNHNKKRNALSLEMIRQLRQNVSDNEKLRLILIKHSGHVFSAGHDLKELTTASGRPHHEKIFNETSDLMLAIRDLPVPVVAQVNGVAAAAGCQLAAACDMIIASGKSQFSTPGGSVGLFCSTPGIAVSRSVGLKMATYMLFTGNSISAQEALRCGLVSQVFDEENLEEKVKSTIDAILGKSKSVIALGKRFFYHQLDQDLKLAYSSGGKCMADNLSLRDAQIGIKAFIEKNKGPINWTHTSEKDV